jgi:hypothetical protein
MNIFAADGKRQTSNRILRSTVSCSMQVRTICGLKLRQKLATELFKTCRTYPKMGFEVRCLRAAVNVNLKVSANIPRRGQQWRLSYNETIYACFHIAP